MAAKKTNILFICCDELNPAVMGCSGDPLVRTPNIDALAARGLRFTNAYTPSPICGPARTSLATGRYVHETAMWDNASPYDGSIRSWGHRLRDAGYRVSSIGKLHYRSVEDDNGFDDEVLGMYATDGVGWVRGLLRSDGAILSDVCDTFARDIGPGESHYTKFDRDVTSRATDWLRQNTGANADPWALFVSFISPHFPLIAPEDFYGLYDPQGMPRPKFYDRDERPDHPIVQAVAEALCYDAGFKSDDQIGVALAGYYGLCSFLDDNIGQLLRALNDAGASGDTLVIFTSDHGDMLGKHGIWGKSVMYEGSTGVPMILAGAGVPEGRVSDVPVSLIDCYPTMMAAAGLSADSEEQDFKGASMLSDAVLGDPGRAVISEYHDGGCPTGAFMLRTGDWKYVHYIDAPPQLFDLKNDPDEVRNLGTVSDYADVRTACEARLRTIVDVDDANSRAFADQAARIEAFGGEDAVRNWGDFGYTPVSG